MKKNYNKRIVASALLLLMCVSLLLFMSPVPDVQAQDNDSRESQQEQADQQADSQQDPGTEQAGSQQDPGTEQADSQQEQRRSTPKYTTFKELNGKKIGLLTGAPFEELISSKVSDVEEFQYFSSISDMKIALKTGKIDAYLMNNAVGELAVNQDRQLALFPEPLGETVFGFAFPKGSADISVWQEAYDRIPQETKDSLWKKWTGADESVKILPEQDWSDENGNVTVASCDTLPPMSYLGKDDQRIGYDIEMILLMARELKVHVEFIGMDFSAVMPYVQSGKAAFGNGSIVVSDERKKTMDFVEYTPAAFVLVVLSKEGEEKVGFWQGLRDSFYRTFIADNRYKMVISGLGVTILIFIASALLGLALALAIVFQRHRNRKVINKIIAVYCDLIACIPAVVILMVLYYIIFVAVDIPAVIVAILGFALIFGARAYGVMWNAICTIDDGQREAALALGYSENLAFRDIIWPQAREIYLPLLKSQIITLAKETSIVGFITVMDLTRAGDLIRSRTMDAFFPLLTIALIYFLLTWVLIYLLGRIRIFREKKHEARLIKGVDR